MQLLTKDKLLNVDEKKHEWIKRIEENLCPFLYLEFSFPY